MSVVTTFDDRTASILSLMEDASSNLGELAAATEGIQLAIIELEELVQEIKDQDVAAKPRVSKC